MRKSNSFVLGILLCGFLVSGIFPCSAGELKINITYPEPYMHMNVSFDVKGTMVGELQKDQYLWILVNPHTAFAQWWPQGGDAILPSDTWYGPALIGRDISQGGEADIGKEFDIAVVNVDKKTHEDLLQWDQTGKVTGNYPGIKFPEGAKIMAKVTVIRK
ncbi:MAG: hypothetical protein PHW87_12360 [Methanothrix sp.]|nr:hypothetical protein [Methanothrix sp.]